MKLETRLLRLLFIAFTLIIAAPLAQAQPKSKSKRSPRFHFVNDSCSMGFKVNKKVEFQRCDDGHYKVEVRKNELKKWSKISREKWLASIERRGAKPMKKSIAFYLGQAVYAKRGHSFYMGTLGQAQPNMKKINASEWNSALVRLKTN